MAINPSSPAGRDSDSVSDASLSDATVQRLSFLATAGEVLASSLDYDETLREVARLALHVLGDFCVVDLIEDGALRRVATAHVLPEKAALLVQLRERYPLDANSWQPVVRVMRTGLLEFLDEITPELVAAHARDAEHEALLKAVGVRTHIAAPLIARGEIIGVIGFGISDSTRRYRPTDISLAQDLARRAAVAIDNARLYRRAETELAERRHAEDALRLSEERFRAILEQSPLSTQILTPDGYTLRVNRAWEELWGLTAEQLKGYSLLEDPVLEELGITPLLRTAIAGEAVKLPPIRYDPNDTLPHESRHANAARWVRSFAYPVKDPAGTVREVVLVHEDVTETRDSQVRLRDSEERLRHALAAGHMHAWELDVRTGMVACSENAAEFWGRNIGDVAEFMAVIHAEDREAVNGAVAHTLESGENLQLEYRVHSPSGVRWVETRGVAHHDDAGRPISLVGVTIDVSSLKRAEEGRRLLADAGLTLGASLEYFATLQNLARLLVPRFADWCAIDLLNETGNLERVTVMHADAARVAVAKDLFERYPPRPGDRLGPWRVMESREPEWSESVTEDALRAAATDETHLTMMRAMGVQSSIRVPLIARDNALGVLTLVYAESGRRYQERDVEVAMDLARRAAAAVDNAQLYQQLREADRRKDEFLATLAHELRNPLAPIRTGLSLLRVTTDAAKAERTRQVMERQLGHMVRLIDDLLDLSRVTRGRIQLEKERVDLWSILGTALEASRPMLEAAGVELSVRLPETPCVLDADRTRLAQVLSNLLNNAAKFTPRGGRVEVTALLSDTDVLIKVIDTGVGIPPHMLTHIFGMFAQVGDSRTQSGLGIGLTLVRSLVELHGGKVWAESRGPGTGSSFALRLPRAQRIVPPAHAPEVVTPAGTTARSRRIMVVDDNVDAAAMLAALLQLHGHDVRTAASAPEALATGDEFRPEIVFLDIGLPGMSGYELARRLRERPDMQTATLVAVTGWGQEDDRRQSKEAGIDHHLTKPVDSDHVLAVVAEATHHDH